MATGNLLILNFENLRKVFAHQMFLKQDLGPFVKGLVSPFHTGHVKVGKGFFWVSKNVS